MPGSKFGDESPWIVAAAALLSKDHRSVTLLINGGEISRKDLDLSLKDGRQIIALSRTGRLADELSRDPVRNQMISIAPANADQQILDLIQAALSSDGRSNPSNKAICFSQAGSR